MTTINPNGPDPDHIPSPKADDERIASLEAAISPAPVAGSDADDPEKTAPSSPEKPAK